MRGAVEAGGLSRSARARARQNGGSISGTTRLLLTTHRTAENFALLRETKEKLAEEKGFEPSEGLHPRRFSKPLPSTTRPLLRGEI